MNLTSLLERRQQEREWHYANGFGNGDPKSNGEYLSVDYFLSTRLSLFLDIGANRGIFSSRVLSYNSALPVQAFEPNPQVIPELELRLRDGENTVLHQIALDEASSGEVSFYVHPLHHETSSLSPRSLMTSKFQAAMKKIKVPLSNLDTALDQSACDLGNVFMKIDTEGHEAGVIRGAKQLLENIKKCAILFEYSFAWKESDEQIESTFQFLNELGFDFYRVLPVGLEHLRFITTDMADIQYCNYMAVKGHNFTDCKTIDIASPLGSNKLVLLA